jgi:hypothetical protein
VWAKPHDGTLGPGTHTLLVQTSHWPSGVYLFSLQGSAVRESGSLVRIR